MVKPAYFDLVMMDLVGKLEAERIFRGLVAVLRVTESAVTRVKVVEEIWLKRGIRPEIPMQKPKNNKIAERLRKKGDKYFIRCTVKSYLRALELYNKSICFAEPGSRYVRNGFVNRSLVYFGRRMFRTCLENISLARKFKCSQLLLNQLDEREGECLDMILLNRSIHDRILDVSDANLTNLAHESNPFVSECVDIRQDNESSPTVIAKAELQVGNIFAVDYPFCEKLAPKLRYQRCENCLKESHYSLIPCRQCTAVMFCDESCYEEAFEKFHKYECPIIDYMMSVIGLEDLTALRLIIRTLSILPSFSDLSTFLDETKRRQPNPFTIDYKLDSAPMQTYGPVASMRPMDLLPSVVFRTTLLSTFIYRILFFHTSFSQFVTTSRSMEVFVEVIYKHLLINEYNGTARTTLLGSYEDLEPMNTTPEEIGRGIYPLRSMLRHSCAPNVVTVSSSGKLLFIALKKIRPGEELFERFVKILMFEIEE